MASKFESLSDELKLKIFEYLAPIDFNALKALRAMSRHFSAASEFIFREVHFAPVRSSLLKLAHIADDELYRGFVKVLYVQADLIYKLSEAHLDAWTELAQARQKSEVLKEMIVDAEEVGRRFKMRNRFARQLRAWDVAIEGKAFEHALFKLRNIREIRVVQQSDRLENDSRVLRSLYGQFDPGVKIPKQIIDVRFEENPQALLTVLSALAARHANVNICPPMSLRCRVHPDSGFLQSLREDHEKDQVWKCPIQTWSEPRIWHNIELHDLELTFPLRILPISIAKQGLSTLKELDICFANTVRESDKVMETCTSLFKGNAKLESLIVRSTDEARNEHWQHLAFNLLGEGNFPQLQHLTLNCAATKPTLMKFLSRHKLKTLRLENVRLAMLEGIWCRVLQELPRVCHLELLDIDGLWGWPWKHSMAMYFRRGMAEVPQQLMDYLLCKGSSLTTDEIATMMDENGDCGVYDQYEEDSKESLLAGEVRLLTWRKNVDNAGIRKIVTFMSSIQDVALLLEVLAKLERKQIQ